MLKYSDLPMLKEHVAHRMQRILELEKLAPTTERLAEIARIEKETKILQRDIRVLKGNMYPYAS